MDQSAIEAIQASTAIAEANKSLTPTSREIVLPRDMRVCNLDHLQPTRRRMTGTLRTESLDGFIAYVNDLITQGFTESACFIDRSEMTAEFVADYGTREAPGHCDLRAVLTLPKTPEFIAIKGANGTTETQDRFAEWCEEWGDYIIFLDGEGNTLDDKSALRAIRQITIEFGKTANHDVQPLSTSLSTLESLNTRSHNVIPTGIKFQIHPYEGLPLYDITARVQVVARKDEPPYLRYRLLRLNLECENMAKAFGNLLASKINSHVYLGAFLTGS